MGLQVIFLSGGPVSSASGSPASSKPRGVGRELFGASSKPGGVGRELFGASSQPGGVGRQLFGLGFPRAPDSTKMNPRIPRSQPNTPNPSKTNQINKFLNILNF